VVAVEQETSVVTPVLITTVQQVMAVPEYPFQFLAHL